MLLLYKLKSKFGATVVTGESYMGLNEMIQGYMMQIEIRMHICSECYLSVLSSKFQIFLHNHIRNVTYIYFDTDPENQIPTRHCFEKNYPPSQLSETFKILFQLLK